MCLVRAAVSREFPGREVTATTPARRGNRKRTAFVTFRDGGEVVVQVSPSPEAFRTEVALVRAVRERTAIPVPRVLAEGLLDGHGYAVLERAPGGDLHERFVDLDAADQAAVARAFGRYLADLHEAFAFEAYGEVRYDADGDAEGPDADGEDGDDSGDSADGHTGRFVATGPTAWRRWFVSYATAGLPDLPPDLADLREPVRAAIEGAEVPERPPSRLFPWDLRPGNALLDGGRVSAVLDWGEPLAAAPGLSVAKAEHLVADWYATADDDGGALHGAFEAGYGSVRPWPSVLRVYRLAAVVRSAVDSRGTVTRPGYPERDGEAAVAFHRERIERLL